MPQILSNRANWVQFFKFGLVGGSGVLVNMLVTIVMNKLHGGTARSDESLFKVLGWSFSFSMFVAVVAFCIANLTNFQLNRTWTFQTSKHSTWWSEFWPFFTVGFIANIFTVIIKALLKTQGSPFYLSLGFFHENKGLHSREYWAAAIAIILTMPINYVVNKLWTFAAVLDKNHKPDDVPLVAPVVAPELVSEDGEIKTDVRDNRNVYETADQPES